jgi:hypothetical protein
MFLGRQAAAVALSTAVALGAATGAWADKEKVQLNAADQAKARAIVVQRDDLGSTQGFTGGAEKPTPPSSFKCATYSPKQSDLVLTGQAKSDYKLPGLEFDSEVQLLKTEKMVTLDWQRTVDAPPVLPCLRKSLAGGLLASEKLVSFEKIPFAKLGTHSAAFRAVVDVRSGGATARLIVDFVLVGVNRTEITLITTAPFSAASSVGAAELRLAQAMLARADRTIA